MKNVKIYTSNTCPYCHLAMDYLKEKNIPFEEKNVSTSAEAKKDLIEKGFMGVPVIYIEDEAIVGFDKTKIDELLKEE